MKKKKDGAMSMGHGNSEHEGKRVGEGDFAGMPQNVKFGPYPKAHEFGPGDLDDTMTEIDMTTREAHSKTHKYLSNQH